MDAGDRFCIICNDGSGRTNLKDKRIEAAMGVLGDRATLRRVRSPRIGPEARRAVAEGFGTVVAAGGDGTLMTVAGVVAGSGARFGVLPFGTLNHFARGHGIPLEPEAAARLLLAGQTRRIPAGEVNGRLFLNNISIGLYPAFLRAREEIERRWGRRWLAAGWSAVKTLAGFQHPLHLDLTAEGRTWQVATPLFFAACSARQLESYGLKGAKCLAEGKFPILVLPMTGRSGLLVETLRLGLGSLREGRDFDLICAREMTIASRSRHLSVACDGEKLRMATPLHLRLRRDALDVIAPPEVDSRPDHLPRGRHPQQPEGA